MDFWQFLGSYWWLAFPIMGVAGGELLIPTIVVLYGIDIKIAGSLSLAVSLPTIARRLRPLQPGQVLRRPVAQQNVLARHGWRIHPRHHRRRRLARCGPHQHPRPLLAAILLMSARKVWQHS